MEWFTNFISWLTTTVEGQSITIFGQTVALTAVIAMIVAGGKKIAGYIMEQRRQHADAVDLSIMVMATNMMITANADDKKKWQTEAVTAFSRIAKRNRIVMPEGMGFLRDVENGVNTQGNNAEKTAAALFGLIQEVNGIVGEKVDA